jgi:hypothetical protein
MQMAIILQLELALSKPALNKMEKYAQHRNLAMEHGFLLQTQVIAAKETVIHLSLETAPMVN